MNDKDNFTISAPDLEPNPCDAPLGTEKIKGLDTPCRVHFHSKRHRLADSDGISGKAVLDGLVHAGILSNDSAIHVKSVTFSQEKTKGPEITEVTITYCDILQE